MSAGAWQSVFDPSGLSDEEVEYLNAQASGADEHHDVQRLLDNFRALEALGPIEEALPCGHMAAELCDCHLQDMYWSGTGESMADESYIDYLNNHR